MTPAQLAELEKLDAAIAAAPDELTLLRARANFWADIGGSNHHALLADCLKMCARSLCYDPYFSAPDEWAWSCDETLDEATRRYYRACAIASCILALERDNDTKGWLSWDASLALFEADAESIRDDFWRLRALDGASVAGYKVEAWLLNVAVGHDAGAEVYGAALRAHWAPDERQNAIVAHFTSGHRWSQPDYKELAWHTFAIENAPADVAPVLQRARWLQFQVDDVEAARADLEWARARFADDIRVYEEQWGLDNPDFRAKTLAQSSQSYQNYIRPILQDGPIAATVESLTGYAQGIRHSYGKWALAHAYYSLILERVTPTAALYLARAQVAKEWFQSTVETEFETNVAEKAAPAILDFARAFELGHLESRDDVVHYLTFDWLRSETGRPTAHQQIEALREIRQKLIEHGLTAATADALLGEVARVWAN